MLQYRQILFWERRSQTTNYTDLTIESFPTDFTISVQEIADKLGIDINRFKLQM